MEYESFGQNSLEESLANTFSKPVYDDKPQEGSKLTRNPPVRRAASREASKDPVWRSLDTTPSTEASGDHHTTDKSPDIFVPTKRTIFTVQGGNRNRDQARATPTFVESQDEELEAREGVKKNSESHPDTDSEGTTMKAKGCVGAKKDSKNMNGHHSNTHSPANELESMTKKPETESSLEAPQGGHADDRFPSADEAQMKVESDQPFIETTSSSNETMQGETDEAEEQIQIQEDSSDAKNPESSQSVEAPSLPCPSTSPLLTNVAITTALLQTPTPTSPPIESKRKVLEAVNEGVPAVRNIIQKFNKRITENQELLGSPFRSPPSSPPWQSPRSQRKLLADLNSCQGKMDHEPASKNLESRSSESAQATPVSPACGVHKSQSASVIVSCPELPPRVQRSASGSCVQDDNTQTNNVKVNISTGLIASPQLSRFRGPSPGEGLNYSSSVSPAVTPAPTDLDTSCDLEITDDAGQAHDRLTGGLRPESRSPAAHIRALRIRKAKEEFLARGAGLPTAEQRPGDAGDPVKLRHRSGTASTEGSWRESDELFAGAPSSTPTEGSSQEREETRDKPPRAASRRRNIPKKESFRRQSAGCLIEESAAGKHSSPVVKSSSSGVLGNIKRHSRYSIDSQSPDRRKDSVDPSGDHPRSPLGIFKLFRRHRSKDKRDMPSVQKLCRQSLLVDFANGRGRNQSASPQPGPEHPLRALPEMEGEEVQEAAAARSSKTLPRGSSLEVAAPLAPSRSCPSSPVAPHRSRTSNWLARGRQIFKSRSPSPGKKAR